MSGLKCGDVRLSAEERRRRDEAARQRREAEQLREAERKRRREIANLRSALSATSTRASEIVALLKELAVTTESPTPASAPDDVESLQAALRQGNARTSLLEDRLAQRRAELSAEVTTANELIEKLALRLQSVRDRAAANRQVLQVPDAPSHINTVISSDTVRQLSEARAAMAQVTLQLERLEDASAKAQLEQLRVDIMASISDASSVAVAAAVPRVSHVERDILDRIATLSDFESFEFLQAGANAAISLAGRADRDLAFEALERRVTEVESARALIVRWLREIDSLLQVLSAGLHEDDEEGALESMRELRARVADISGAVTPDELIRRLAEMEAGYATDLARARETSERAGRHLEVARRNQAFLRALERHGYQPQRDRLARVRVPRDGVLVADDAASDELLVQVYQHSEHTERRIAILQSAEDDERIFALASDSQGNLTAKLAGALDPTSPDPAWVEDWCDHGLPEAKALLEESGYDFAYQSVVDAASRAENDRSDRDEPARRARAAKRQIDK